MKICSRCLESKDSSCFYKKVGPRDGLSYWCKVCHGKLTAARHKVRRADPDFCAAETKRVLEWRTENTEAFQGWVKKYTTANKDKLVEKAARYRAGKYNRTPLWVDDDAVWMMEEAYTLAKLRETSFGFQWGVDHIIPLHGRQVSGLHVPLNLQVIPMKDNRQKGNKF